MVKHDEIRDLLGGLVGCSSSTSYQEVKGNGYFALLTKWDDGDFKYQIVYASDTKVKYLISYNDSYQQGSFGITPLYNADGTLQVYGEEE